MKHRPDIQGLRALAVSLVVLDHASIGPFSGGFVGVDVFFVVSGFLITGLLLREAAATGSVSILGFYARRARRILPAAALVLVVTLVASVLGLDALRAETTIRDSIWAAFFLANIKFALDGTDYFAATADPSPLQHYWSLAVEEQFYVVWPLLILVIWWAARRPARVVPAVCGLVICGSLAWSICQTQHDAVFAYFSPLTRAWELALGGLVAWRLTRSVRRPMPFVSGVGLAAILVAAVDYDALTPFPGSAALLPVVGTALLLLAGAGEPGLLQRILSLKPVTAVGDWSYSVYLWHWPALIFVPLWLPADRVATGLSAIAVSVVLAALTYRYVETPLRRPTTRWFSYSKGVLLFPTAVGLTLATAFGANAYLTAEVGGDGAAITTTRYGQSPEDPEVSFDADPTVALVQASVLAARNGMAIPADLDPALLEIDDEKPNVGECDYMAIVSDRPVCPMGDPTAERSIVLVGDSHARQWIPAIEQIAIERHYRAYFFVREGCPAAHVTPWLKDRTGPSLDCQDFQSWTTEQIALLHPELVVMAQRAEPNPGGYADAAGQRVRDPAAQALLVEQGVRDLVSTLRPLTDGLVAIVDAPYHSVSPAKCLGTPGATLTDCLAPVDAESIALNQALVDVLMSTNTPYIDAGPWFCSDTVCPAVVGHFIPRRDVAHVSVAYATHLAEALERELLARVR